MGRNRGSPGNGAGILAVNRVKDLSYNSRINSSGHLVTPRAGHASRHVSHAGYRERYPYTGMIKKPAPCLMSLTPGASPNDAARTGSKTSALFGGRHARGPALPQATRSISTLGVRNTALQRGILRKPIQDTATAVRSPWAAIEVHLATAQESGG